MVEFSINICSSFTILTLARYQGWKVSGFRIFLKKNGLSKIKKYISMESHTVSRLEHRQDTKKQEEKGKETPVSSAHYNHVLLDHCFLPFTSTC